MRRMMGRVLVALGLLLVADGALAADTDYRTWLRQQSRECTNDDQPSSCQSDREWYLREIDGALDGRYQSLRAVAFCLTTGCDGAVATSKVGGCAWRIIILSRPEADESDAENWKTGCHLDAEEFDATVTEAHAIHRLLFGRDLPDAALARVSPKRR